jgi:hypothetical protein
MSNSTYEYTLTQDGLQIQAQLAIDELLLQAYEDEEIDKDTFLALSEYVVIIQTNRSFSDRLRELLKLQKDPQNGKLQTVWLATRPCK